MREDIIKAAKEKFVQSVSKIDILIKMFEVYEGLAKSENLIFQSVNSFLFLFFPEASIKLDLGSFLSLEKIDEEEIKERYKYTYGAPLETDFKELLSNSLSELKRIHALKESYYSYIEKMLKEVFPNSSEIIESNILIKIVKELGDEKSIKELTLTKLQSLGNPKSFYKVSFGILYNSKMIESKKDRIKAARKLSQYLLKALKIDVFRKEKDEKLIEEFKKEMEKIK